MSMNIGAYDVKSCLDEVMGGMKIRERDGLGVLGNGQPSRSSQSVHRHRLATKPSTREDVAKHTTITFGFLHEEDLRLLQLYHVFYHFEFPQTV